MKLLARLGFASNFLVLTLITPLAINSAFAQNAKPPATNLSQSRSMRSVIGIPSVRMFMAELIRRMHPPSPTAV